MNKLITVSAVLSALLIASLAIFDFFIRDYFLNQDSRYTIGVSVGLKPLGSATADPIKINYSYLGKEYSTTVEYNSNKPWDEGYRMYEGGYFVVKFSPTFPSIAEVDTRFRIQKIVHPPDSGWNSLDALKAEFE